MDIEHEQNRRYAETTERLYLALIGLGLCSVAALWTMIVNELIGG